MGYLLHKHCHNKMDYDAVLTEIGEFGPWQQLTIVLLWIPPMMAGIHNLLFVFTGLTPKNGYRCQIPGCDDDEFEFSDFPDSLFPLDADGDPDYCKFYMPRFTDEHNNTCSSTDFDTDSVSECHPGVKFAFAEFEFKETLVTKWENICGKKPLISFVQIFYIAGLLVGSFLSGKLADKFGRKPALMFSILISSGGELMGSFMPEFYSYSVARFLTGVGQQGLFNCSFSLSIEIVGKKLAVPFLPWVSLSTVLGVAPSASFAVGIIILSSVASLFNTWFTLQLTASCISFLQLLLWFIIPESPRWLISTKRFKEAKALIKKAAERNGKHEFVKTFTMAKLETNEKPDSDGTKSSLGFSDLFDKRILLFTIVQMVAWPAVSLGYFGLSYGSADMEGNFFVNNIILGVVELPGYLYVILLMDVWGRKPLFVLSLVFTGVSSIVSSFLTGTARNILIYIAKNTASGAFALVFVYTSELFPTSVRSTGLGLCSMMARVGALFTPLMGDLAKATVDEAPYYLLGGFAALSGLLSILLPETLGNKLPEDIEDIKEMKKNSKSMLSCVKQVK